MYQILFVCFFLGYWFYVENFYSKVPKNFENFFQKILLFSTIFPLIYIFQSYFLLLNIGNKNILYLKLFIIFFSLYGFYQLLKKQVIKRFKFKFKLEYKSLVFIFFFSYFIISLFFYQ